MDYHPTQAAEMLLVGILGAAPGISGVASVFRQVEDEPKTRPAVIVLARIREALIPDGMYSVYQTDFTISIETQFAQQTAALHDALIQAAGVAIPPIGKYTAAQPYFESISFGPTHGGQQSQTELVRIYEFTGYLVGRLVIPIS
jgi:hypothetical protein